MKTRAGRQQTAAADTLRVCLPAQVAEEKDSKERQGLYIEVGCNRRWRGDELVAIETASMELARLAGEPLTVGKEVSLGEPGRRISDDS